MTEFGAEPVRRIGRFVLRRELGRGGSGVVYLALDPSQQLEVAVKVLLDGEHAAPESVERFLRESRAISRLAHQNIVRVHEVGWWDGRPYLAMDYLPGRTLAQRLDDGPIPADLAIRWLRDLAGALSAAHESAIVHRDVKPGNVLFDNAERPILTDFGLATDTTDPRLTRTGQIVGTPTYLAPETARRAPPHPTADVYSLGAVGYHLLAGRPPYSGDSSVEVLYAMIAGPPEPLNQVAPSTPPELATIIEAAMAREPEARYPSGRELERDLAALLDGRTIHPPTASVSLRMQRARERWGPSATIAALILTVGVVSVQGARLWNRQQRAAEVRTHQQDASRLLAGIGEADRTERLRTFAADPNHARTPAVAQALLELAAAEPDPAVATELCARAYAEGGVAEQERALRELASRFAANREFPSLQAALAQLERRTPGSSVRPEIASLLADGAGVQHDFAAAALHLTTAGRPGASLMAGWSRATDLGPAPATSTGVLEDSDGDGRLEWWRSDGQRIVRSRLDELTAPPTVVASFGARVWNWSFVPGVTSGDRVFPPVLVVSIGESPASVELRTLQGEPLYAWPDSPHQTAVREPDGPVLVGIGAYRRHTVRLTPLERGGFEAEPGIPEIDRLSSDVNEMAWLELDGVAPPELAISLGAWAAYDLRLYRAGALRTPLARRKVGFLNDLVVERATPRDHLWTLKGDRYGSAEMFPAGRPFGDPPGAVRWALGADGLAPEVVLPAPGTGPMLAEGLVVADLDGDGVVDPTFASGDRQGRWVTAVYPASRPGPPLLVGDCRPLFAADLDPAIGNELVVQCPFEGPESRVWVLGSGTGNLPIGGSPPLPLDAPEELEAEATAGWRRAEELASMGLFTAAAAQLERVSAQGGGSAALARASTLWTVGADPDRAAEDQLQAARLGRPELYVEASRTLRSQHRFTEAVQALSDAGAPPDPALSATAKHLRTLDVPLGATWPGAATLTGRAEAKEVGGEVPGRAFEVLVGDGAALELPFTSGAGELEVSMSLDLTRTEWGSGLVAQVETTGGPLTVGVRVWGGGGVYEREVFCETPSGLLTDRRLPLASPGQPLSVTVRAALSALEGSASCRIEIDHVVTLHVEPLADGTSLVAGGPKVLRVRSSDHSQLTGPLFAATLRDLSVSGVDAQVVVRSPSAPGRFSALWQAADRRDEASLRRELEGLPVDEEIAKELRRLLRLRPTLAGPAVRARFPAEYFGWFHEAWGTPFRAHPNDPELAAPWLSETNGVEAALTGPHRTEAALVLLNRSRAWIEVGQLGGAERDLLAASTVLDPATATGLNLEFDVAATWVWLAHLATVQGDARAGRALERARTYVPSELADDLIRARGN